MAKKPNQREDPPAASSSDDEEAQSSSSSEEEVEVVTKPKPPPPKSTAKPSVSSKVSKQVSESEEEDSSDEEESSSEDKVDPKPTVSAPTTKPKPTTTNKPTVSSKVTKEVSESGSETESESESEPEEPTTVTKPKKKESLPSSSALPPVKSGAKRPNEGSSRDDAKRVKKDSTTAEDTSKKPGAFFERKWSLDDELALLQSIINFKKDKGNSPNEDTNQFFDSVKNKISLEELSKSQVMEKIRSLRKKYTRKGKNGKYVVFTASHDLKCFELAKSLWGVNGICVESGTSNVLSRKSERKDKKLETVKQDLFAGRSVEEVAAAGDNKGLVSGGGEVEVSDWFDESFLVRSIAGFGLHERAVKQGWRSAPVEGKKRIKEEMKELRVKEFEYVALRSDIVKEAAFMIAEVIKHQDI